MPVKATTSIHGDRATITPAGSPAAEIAAALLAAADNPTQVRTVTTPVGMGWDVPLKVAEGAGLITTAADPESLEDDDTTTTARTRSRGGRRSRR